jgi:hypothetical protein
MSAIKKLMMTAAGGGFTAIEDVFSTYLYAGNQTARTITNGIDLAGEGGLTWITPRTVAAEMQFIDSERGVSPTSTPVLISSLTNGQINRSGAVTAYNSDGFDLGTYDATNYTGRDMVSWTFRKAPRFFDVVTWTGNGSSQTIAHNLGVEPGCIIVKNTSATANWAVYHRGTSASAFNQRMQLNTTDAVATSATAWNGTAPTDTEFSVGNFFNTNASGNTYVAYLYAHDPLGPSGDGSDGLIACGSYTGNGTIPGPVINIGWEPQWLLIKATNSTSNWAILDVSRGMPYREDAYLAANVSTAEAITDLAHVTATGFQTAPYGHSHNSLGVNYIYIAIRRGPMRVPESGTEVFGGLTHTGTGVGRSLTDLGFSPDLLLSRPRNIALGYGVYDRLRGFLGSNQILQTYNTGAEFSDATGPNASITKIEQGVISLGPDSFYGHTNLNTRPYITHAFRRAPGFFDVVAYTGDNVAGRTISHNLGVAPEMIWVKKRSEATDWNVYHSGLGPTKTIWLNQTSTGNTHPDYWYNTAPTSSVFSVGGGNPNNYTTRTYIAYLFATLAGVSKVGSYTGTGTHDEHVIDCGFTSGARFVLLKRTDAVSDWFVWDSERGITTGADPRLSLNIAAAEYNGLDDIHPHPSGFIAANPNGSDVNALNSQWIFYAIA